MHDVIRLELEKWGLPAAEAQAYLALIRNGSLGASGIASAIGMPRTSVYPVLESLLQKGLVEAGAGVGSRYTAIRPKEALPSLMVREREELLQRDRITANLIKQLEALAQPSEANGDIELVQVFKDPRIAAERFERLQLEANEQVDCFIKYPIFNPQYTNPTQQKAMRRGVRYRGLYERAILDAPEIKPYLSRWVAAGEEARVHDGELPHKLAIFDRQNILLPLVTPGGQTKTLFVRHPQLALSLGAYFESLWEKAEAITPAMAKQGEAGGGRKRPRDRTSDRAAAASKSRVAPLLGGAVAKETAHNGSSEK